MKICAVVILIGLAIGFLADFLSRTVLIGFLTGVGFQVGIAVLSDMLKLEVHGTNPVKHLLQVVRQLPHANVPTLCLSVGVVALVLLSYCFVPRFPGALLAVVGAVAASAAFHFSGYGIQVVGSVAGGLPHLSVPPLNWRLVRELLPVAGSCFVMIVAQSSVTARAYAAKHHQTLDENRDLLGISAANAAAALSGTFVVNGSPTSDRDGRNLRWQQPDGAPLDGPHGHARAPFPHRSPAISSGLRAWRDCLHHCRPSRGFARFKRSPPEEPSRVDSCPRNRCFRVCFGVEDGILLALVLSLLQHVRHSYEPSVAKTQTADGNWQASAVEPGHMAAPGLVVYWFGSDLFYANIDRFATQVRKLATESPSPVRWLVVDAGAITSVDYTAGGTLKELVKDLAQHGIALVFVWGESRLIFGPVVGRSRAVCGTYASRRARRPARFVVPRSFSALGDQRAEMLPVERPPALAVGGRCMMRFNASVSVSIFLLSSIMDQRPLRRGAFRRCPEDYLGNLSGAYTCSDRPVNLQRQCPRSQKLCHGDRPACYPAAIHKTVRLWTSGFRVLAKTLALKNAWRAFKARFPMRRAVLDLLLQAFAAGHGAGMARRWNVRS